MKTLLGKAVLIALLTGPLVAFLNTVAWTRATVKYDPPITQAEMEQWKKLPVTELQAKLMQRLAPLSKWQWLSESVHYGYFWKQVALSSVLPTIGVFLACLCLGRWLRAESSIKC